MQTLLNTLYVTTPLSYLHLDNDTVRVEVERETRLRVPLHHLGAVVCFGHVSVSVPLMHRLADDGVALVLLDTDGRFKARLEGATAGNCGCAHTWAMVLTCALAICAVSSRCTTSAVSLPSVMCWCLPR